MHIYTLIKDGNVLGEKHETYGYTYWAETDKGPVMFNSQRQGILSGTQIVAEEVESKTSSKGNHYTRLKKAKVGESMTSTTPELIKPVTGDQTIKAIAGDLKLALSMLRSIQKSLGVKVEDVVVEVDDEAVSLEDFGDL